MYMPKEKVNLSWQDRHKLKYAEQNANITLRDRRRTVLNPIKSDRNEAKPAAHEQIKDNQ